MVLEFLRANYFASVRPQLSASPGLSSRPVALQVPGRPTFRRFAARKKSEMKSSPKPSRYRAVSMELAAYLDDRYVEMHIITDIGETLAIVCPSDSIVEIQRHIERLIVQCPEIATWSPTKPAEASDDKSSAGWRFK